MPSSSARSAVSTRPPSGQSSPPLFSPPSTAIRDALEPPPLRRHRRPDPRTQHRAAELLDALPDGPDADADQPDADGDHNLHHGRSPSPLPSAIFSANPDPDEAALEAAELSRYLLAKSFFDCKEYDRCAAVFLPDSLLSTVLASPPKAQTEATAQPKHKTTAKGKARALDSPPLHPASPSSSSAPSTPLPAISQKSLFLALYAKFLSGEKRKNEESEMVMGPQDLGTVVNRQLLLVGRYLDAWFRERTTDDDDVAGSQGWLEYLYVAAVAASISFTSAPGCKPGPVPLAHHADPLFQVRHGSRQGEE